MKRYRKVNNVVEAEQNVLSAGLSDVGANIGHIRDSVADFGMEANAFYYAGQAFKSLSEHEKPGCAEMEGLVHVLHIQFATLLSIKTPLMVF